MQEVDLYTVLHRIYLQGVTVQSNFARANMEEVAALASLGLISTKIGPRTFGKVWRITEAGIETLRFEGRL